MKDPAFLFYSQDFITGTLAMPFEERGRYITLLCYQHQTGRMSEETISFLVGYFSDMLRLKFLVDENGLFYNERLEIEINKRNKFIESRVNNGSLGGRPKKEKKPLGKANGKAKNNLPENENKCIYSSFYDEQIKLSNDNSDYIKFVKYLFGENKEGYKFEGVLSIVNQLTFEQFEISKEKARLNGTKVLTFLSKIENDKKYWKGKVNLNTTLENWITGRFVK